MKKPLASFLHPWMMTLTLLKEFFFALSGYINQRLFFSFYRFEKAKRVVVGGLTTKRGKYVRPFLHSSMTGLFLVGLAVAPLVQEALPEEPLHASEGTGGAILGQSVDGMAAAMVTQVSDKGKGRDTIYTYTAQPGDTISSVAKMFQLNPDTIKWHNDLKDDSLKAGQTLEIPPIDGIVHKVKRGDTIYSIAKKYGVDPQAIVNWPYNSYTDDENFGLAVGQTLVVPEGIKPKEQRSIDPGSSASSAFMANRQTPNAGAVSASGQFVWPTSGVITQRFVWYHTGLDIANASSPDILAADSGTIILAGWPDNSGYANRIIIDHGNGFQTLYAHLQAFYVKAGQTVQRGDPIGKMGNTGRSTGTHLHFEIRTSKGNVDPLQYLK